MHEIGFMRFSLKLYIPATMFYSSLLTSDCQADDIPGSVWRTGDETVHVYRTEVPWTPIHLRHERNNFAILAWTAIISVVISVAIIVCLCCLCWKLGPKYSARRQSSNAALVPPSQGTPAHFLPPVRDDSRTARNYRRGNSYNRGITNSSFTDNPGVSAFGQQLEDVPPAYSIVISQAIPSEKEPHYPPVSEIKTVETPPPSYVTVAPFR